MKMFLIAWGIGFLITSIFVLLLRIFRSDSFRSDSINDFIGFIGIYTIFWPIFLIMFIKDRMWESDTVTKMPDQK
jgi:hypothetical protein